jgi:hypothetical protein
MAVIAAPIRHGHLSTALARQSAQQLLDAFRQGRKRPVVGQGAGGLVSTYSSSHSRLPFIDMLFVPARERIGCRRRCRGVSARRSSRAKQHIGQDIRHLFRGSPTDPGAESANSSATMLSQMPSSTHRSDSPAAPRVASISAAAPLSRRTAPPPPRRRQWWRLMALKAALPGAESSPSGPQARRMAPPPGHSPQRGPGGGRRGARLSRARNHRVTESVWA